jgi:hypothetical protein
MTDDTPRLEAAARLFGEAVRLLDGVMSGPGKGRLLRRAADADGRHLFSTAETPKECVWWPAGTLADVLRAIRAAVHARQCKECAGAGCPRCQNVGYTSPQLRLSPTPPTLPLEGDVSELWGWVRGDDK